MLWLFGYFPWGVACKRPSAPRYRGSGAGGIRKDPKTGQAYLSLLWVVQLRRNCTVGILHLDFNGG